MNIFVKRYANGNVGNTIIIDSGKNCIRKSHELANSVNDVANDPVRLPGVPLKATSTIQKIISK